MSDFISRQAAIEALDEEPDVWLEDDYSYGLRDQWRYDKTAIEAVPSENVVEVVRCKECKYYDDTPPFSYCVQNSKYVDDDGFCSDGERRTDGKILY